MNREERSNYFLKSLFYPQNLLALSLGEEPKDETRCAPTVTHPDNGSSRRNNATTDWYGDDDEESALPFAQIGEEMKLDLVDE